MIKTCTRCNESKPLTEFNADKIRPDGYAYWCRSCVKAYNAERKAAKAAPVSEDTLLTCSTCGNQLAARMFHHNKAMLTGRMNQCKMCCAKYYDQNASEKTAYRRGAYRKDRKRFLAASREYQKANPAKMRGYDARRRAAKHGVEIEAKVTQEQWLGLLKQANWQCHYCKRDIFQPTAKPSALDATQDHIIPLIDKGPHAIENIVPACRRCNSLKHDWSYEAFLDRIKNDPDIFSTSEEAPPLVPSP